MVADPISTQALAWRVIKDPKQLYTEILLISHRVAL